MKKMTRRESGYTLSQILVQDTGKKHSFALLAAPIAPERRIDRSPEK